ncbi:MAG TPA: hypothetical protein VIL30_18705 [Ramlibacter sp.]|jgi:hypothetical protein
MSVEPNSNGLKAAIVVFEDEFNGTYSGADLVTKTIIAYLAASRPIPALEAMGEDKLREASDEPWCPDFCPITGRRFFMWIDGEPTYGGPFDSYTIPLRDENGEFYCRQYDHDEGGWKDWSIGLGLILKTDEDWIDLEDRLQAAEALVERLKLEAQAHASEARTANSTIYEIYQVISGGKGEPGNWNGAEPVRAYVQAAEAKNRAYAEALEKIAQDTSNTTFGPWPTRGAEIARATLQQGAKP